MRPLVWLVLLVIVLGINGLAKYMSHRFGSRGIGMGRTISISKGESVESKTKISTRNLNLYYGRIMPLKI